MSEKAPHHHARDLTRAVIKACAQEHEFALAGVCTLEPSAFAAEFRAWLHDSKHGSMEYLERNLELRLDPSKVLDGARSAIVVGDLYATHAINDDPALKPGHGRIARYARGKDYHKVMKKRLHALADALANAHPGHAFRAVVDTAPVLERELASRAGIGWTGKHTLTINPTQGSYMLLGVLFTTLELEPEPDPTPDHCGSCTRCIEACPTDAITPYSVDGTRCISYLTIEHRSEIDPSLWAGMGGAGGWVFGCDICQEVCPHNASKPTRSGVPVCAHDAYIPRPGLQGGFDLLEVLGWNEDARREAFQGSSMKRATLAMMKRNAIILLSNQMKDQPNTRVLARLKEIAADDSEPDLVRQTAKEALES